MAGWPKATAALTVASELLAARKLVRRTGGERFRRAMRLAGGAYGEPMDSGRSPAFLYLANRTPAVQYSRMIRISTALPAASCSWARLLPGDLIRHASESLASRIRYLELTPSPSGCEVTTPRAFWPTLDESLEWREAFVRTLSHPALGASRSIQRSTFRPPARRGDDRALRAPPRPDPRGRLPKRLAQSRDFGNRVLESR